ncbi:hypothetical protein NCS57_00917300 [Fusarium keratoplasticum]|uniref:Uncharacterized protein n=1 Tax=Fusarium keratoplasticum TaxID=1328300 RepID=A0ACC0QPB6_9HYPO|nr:hypothetical protein NCS57_00917300 [Fusarium keratoplasticum]KAI8663172.1 hypothetical protein NCS57_00917300 [Fusarium keratoplasticum]KAI8663873.1 hypothetical protein NCS55_00893400 [Fusarium keratoplasticum]
MRANELFLALVPVVLANPILRSEKTQDVHIVLELSKEASQAAVTVWNKDQSEAIANSCSESLASAPFENHAIAFKVDENGSGNLTVGDKSYSIGGGDDAIECGRIASETELVVNCIVSLPGSVELKPLGKRGLKTCFPDGPLEVTQAMDVFEGKVESESPSDVAPAELSQAEVDKIVKENHLDKRQTPCGIWTSQTRRVGNGNPHQNPLNIQLSEPMQCPGHIGCSTYHTTSRSYSIGWSANAATSWISAGFDVVRTIETGNSYVCNGNPNDFFAVWKNQGQTAYTVQNGVYNSCTNSWLSVGGHIIVWSPNANNRRGFYYCVYGRNYVRAMGDRWLDTSPNTPGGP